MYSSISGRPCVLTVAGFDPSGGAGVLADCKTFEILGAFGFGVCAALTFQSDKEFRGLTWIDTGEILKQLDPIAERFEVKVAKIGLVSGVEALTAVVEGLKARWPKVEIIWDPIARASAGFEFHSGFAPDALAQLYPKLSLVTPNLNEISLLCAQGDAQESARALSRAVAVLLKGGHADGDTVQDLFVRDGQEREFSTARIPGIGKHGSGCVLSAAIASYRAHGSSWELSIEQARRYVARFLASNGTLLGFHSWESA